MNINFKKSTIYLLFKINNELILQNYLFFKIRKEKKDNLLKKQKKESHLRYDFLILSHNLFCFCTSLAKQTDLKENIIRFVKVGLRA